VREARNAKSAPSALDKGSLIDGVPGTPEVRSEIRMKL
jgi:hypothetical protein